MCMQTKLRFGGSHRQLLGRLYKLNTVCHKILTVQAYAVHNFYTVYTRVDCRVQKTFGAHFSCNMSACNTNLLTIPRIRIMDYLPVMADCMDDTVKLMTSNLKHRQLLKPHSACSAGTYPTHKKVNKKSMKCTYTLCLKKGSATKFFH